MFQRCWKVLPVLTAGALGLGTLVLYAQDSRPPGNSTQVFVGKSVFVVTKAAPDRYQLLMDVEIKTLGEIRFLVGTNRGNDRFKSGLPVWIALDNISDIALYPSLRDFETRLADAEQAQPKE